MQLLRLFLFMSFLQIPFVPVLSLNQEGLYLQQVKLGFDDPDGALSTWNQQDSTPCNWKGVKCNPTFSVTSVDLSNFNLIGPFPTFLCRLQNLSFISLSDNNINGSLPLDISTCQNLQHLDLSQNILVGPLPPSLPSISNLLYLDLSFNNFTAQIPPSFATFPKLEVISLVSNLFNETVPPYLGNISTLNTLNLSYNPFAPSPIPPDFGNLTNLQYLWLAGCNFIGPIPPSLGHLNRLINLDVSFNHLVGTIPPTFTLLSSIVQIELYNNSLSGTIPIGMSNLTSLRRFDVSTNHLQGEIPDDLCSLPLQSLNLFENQLYGPVPESIARSPNLYELRLYGNRLNGSLPPELGRNSPLAAVDISDNLFSGEIPENLCEKGFLEALLFIGNSFTGKIPDSLGQCLSLTRIRLKSNQLSGEVPGSFWGLPRVWLLELADNLFSGEISPAISGASNLSLLLISDNQFTGRIPAEVGSVQTLVQFSGSNNRLSGSIPETVGKLAQLEKLDLHSNQISGEIPSEIRSWKKLSELNLAENEISGKIPYEIGYLPVLNYLDLSRNQLTGKIPLDLQNLKLNLFNLSNNRLSGELPPLYANEMYRESFLGNPGLCGDLKGLCSDSQKGAWKSHRLLWLLRSIFVLAGLVFVVGVGWFCWRYRNFKKSKRCAGKLKWKLTSFHKLGFSEYEILDCLQEDNVIGSGASGKVYKGVLSNGQVVAVKKIWGGSKKGGDDEDNDRRQRISDDLFKAEVNTLGKIRHKNIVKLWCCCTTRDSKLLVYEYMPNGSLGDLLHKRKGSLLDWPTRFKIAVDAAEGLSYLHHDCVPPIVHRDVKSNNILLDGEFGARVADFGVAKMVGKGPESMSVIAGSCGYIAPEYGYTLRVNEKSDVYSFGVVILELVTGKQPVDPEFGEKDLVKWVCTTLEQKGVDHVLDPNLNICFKEEMCKVLDIGLLCASPLPINRPSMPRVVKMLLEMEKKQKSGKKDGKLSPYYCEDGSENGSAI